jgi:heme-degrading monooxygenase HmoA
MREPKRALNLPMIIGQNPTVPGCRWYRIFNRLRCNDVNSALIASNARVLCSHCTLREELMIGVLTHHWAKVDRVDEARKLLDRNGDAQSKAPGFVSRQTLIALADPAKITTLVVWTTNDIYEAWRASPQRTMAMSGADRLWAKPPESERFQLVG